jgi:hypothetical protein
MIGEHTLGEIVLSRLFYHSYRLTLTVGSLRRLGTLESPTDYPRRPRPCLGDRHQPKELTVKYLFGSHLRRQIMGGQARA